MRLTEREHPALVDLAIRSGVKIAYGTDIGEGDHAMEFDLLVAAGMKPIDALATATRNAADLLGAADRIGSVQPGRFADLIAVAQNPLTTPQALEQVAFVMKGGVVYRSNGAPTTAGAN